MFVEDINGDVINFDHVSVIFTDKREMIKDKKIVPVYTIRASMNTGAEYILSTYESAEELNKAMSKVRRLLSTYSIETIPQVIHCL